MISRDPLGSQGDPRERAPAGNRSILNSTLKVARLLGFLRVLPLFPMPPLTYCKMAGPKYVVSQSRSKKSRKKPKDLNTYTQNHPRTYTNPISIPNRILIYISNCACLGHCNLLRTLAIRTRAPSLRVLNPRSHWEAVLLWVLYHFMCWTSVESQANNSSQG